MENSTLAFVGLGNIGGGAAANLARAGHDLIVFDLDEERTSAVTALGARAAGSLAEVAAADVLFTSLPGPKQIEAVGREVLPTMKTGALWIELSTNDLATARTLHAAAQANGIGYVDAPVSGGPEGAAAGTLSIFVGGEPGAVEAARPLLDVIGSKVDHVGPLGAGIVAKIAQVTLCYTQTVTLIEALLLGAKGGVEPAMMLDLIQHSAGRSYVADTYGPEILAGTYDASFPISHAAKDMRLAMELAEQVGADLPFMADVERLYAKTEATYGSDAAHCLAAQLLERKNDVILSEKVAI